MKKQVKFISMFSFLLTFLMLGLINITTHAAEVSGQVRLWTNENARVAINGNGMIPNMTSQSLGLDQVRVTLKNANNEVISTVITGENDSHGAFRFTNLSDGQYTIEVDHQNTMGIQHEFISIPNINDGSPDSQLFTIFGDPIETSNTKVINIQNDQSIENIYFAVEHRPYAVTLITRFGNFEYTDGVGGTHLDKIFPLFVGGATYFEFGGRTYITNLGVLAMDSLNEGYSNTLPSPLLSQEEQEYGYEHVGWVADSTMQANYPELFMANGNPIIMTTDQVVNIQAKGDMTFRAVFTNPTYNIIFATDIEKGTLDNGKSFISKNVDGANKVVSDVFNTLPTPDVKPGYEFVGWYVDETTNLVSNDDISNTKVKSNLTYYAKYKKLAPVIAIDPNTNTWIIDGVDTHVPATGPAGQNGVDGVDGVTPTVEIDANGYWVINGKQTNIKANSSENNNNPIYQKGGLLPQTGSQEVIMSIVIFGAVLFGFAGYFLGSRKVKQSK